MLGFFSPYWQPLNSTCNSIFKLEAIWASVMLLTNPSSQSDSDIFFVLCLCLIYLDVFAFFNLVPLLYLIPARLRTWYIFPLTVMLSLLLFLVLPSLYLSLSLSRSLSSVFLVHNKPLTPPLSPLSPAHYGFSCFSVSIPCSRIILYVRRGQHLSSLCKSLLQTNLHVAHLYILTHSAHDINTFAHKHNSHALKPTASRGKCCGAEACHRVI